MPNENLREVPGEQKGSDSSWVSLLFGPDAIRERELTSKEKQKMELFEKGLSMQLKKTDTIDGAVQTMVKVALGAEFGPSLLREKGAGRMVETICQGIMTDGTLRKQALIIIDRFAQ